MPTKTKAVTRSTVHKKQLRKLNHGALIRGAEPSRTKGGKGQHAHFSASVFEYARGRLTKA